MMVRTPDSSEDLFAEAGTNWDLQKLYKDLAVAKQDFAPHMKLGLRDVEKLHLRGLLCDYAPAIMAEKIQKSYGGLRTALSQTIYRYVEQLTKQPLYTLKNWRDIPKWLEQTGYKIQLFDAVDGEKALASYPSEDIEALVQKVRSHFDKTIQDECTNLCTFNLGDIPMQTNLTKMYVQTRLNESQGLGSSEFSQERQLSNEIVLKYPKLIVLGKPGAGKTTLLQYIALNCDEIEFQPKLVPVFISLKTLVENAKHTEEIDILGYIQNKYCCNNVSEQELKSLLSHGRLLFLLDGLDEVIAEKISIVNPQIYGLIDSNNRFIVSCRKEFTAYKSKSFAKFIFCKIADFDRTQREYFIEKWFDEVVVIPQQRPVKANDLIKKLDLPENQRIRELADTPLLLHLICLIFQERGDLPSKRVDIYREAIDLLLEKWNQFNKRLHIDVVEFKKVLRRIAAKTFETGKSYFEEVEISPIIGDYPQILHTTEVLSGLIIKKGWRQYAFSHQTFQEYLTAEEFVNSKQLLSQLIIHITEPRWREVFLLVAEMLMPADADDLLWSIKESIDRLLENQIFQDFLQWLDDKSTQVKEVESLRYKLASIRSLYFDLALELDGPNSVYTDENTLAYAIDPAINDNLDPHINDNLDLNFYDALRFENFYNSASSGAYSFFNIPLDLDLVNHLNHLISSTINPELQCKLQELKDCILEPEADFERRQQRWKSHRFIWIKQLRNMMIKYRNIGHDWQFNNEQIKLLKQYYEANKLLWECLAISNVSVEVRSHIEYNLFLPVDSSLSSKKQGKRCSS
ncbi:NACHT domain-containing protein [Microcoleus anatoxicus]|uniref:NACHT domain-containing protein n=1 Tax=Microcoleus anatoxicus PTRS2 TaxID=2705321 RepID=A0ABU8YV87_9CYAN